MPGSGRGRAAGGAGALGDPEGAWSGAGLVGTGFLFAGAMAVLPRGAEAPRELARSAIVRSSPTKARSVPSSHFRAATTSSSSLARPAASLECESATRALEATASRSPCDSACSWWIREMAGSGKKGCSAEECGGTTPLSPGAHSEGRSGMPARWAWGGWYRGMSPSAGGGRGVVWGARGSSTLTAASRWNVG